MTEFQRNNLDRETSPYLLQHKDNPVHWQAWSQAAIAEAERLGKPILLSVGYAACHWCHVMAHESFEDEATAAVMNAHFINIKVDREERPDIDAIYQSALALLGEQGGWPLTMFLNGRAEPFWGGTYFPPEPRFGRPAFVDVLHRVTEIYRDDPATIEKNRTALIQALHDRARPSAGDTAPPVVSDALLNQIAERLLREIDTVHGGIGRAPKFPQTYLLELIWRAYLRTGDRRFRDGVMLTLDKMCQGGIYDHLGGGFARYATDDAWLVPHFEKMLYDNALLLDLLATIDASEKNPLYEARVAETADWILREMTTPEGGFAAAWDADSEGAEGKYYVWNETEIDQTLGADSALFKATYDVTADGNWEDHTILNRSSGLKLGTEDEEAVLARLRALLKAHRDKRIKPGFDDKILADWNGLAIAALASAGVQYNRADWIEAARRAFDFITTAMRRADGGLHHSWRLNQAKHFALLDDYAAMSRAALRLFEISGETRYLKSAQDWTAYLDKYFWDAIHGGYFFTGSDGETLITRTRHASDNAVPSGNGMMLEVLMKLFLLTGEDGYRQKAEALQNAFAPELARNFFPLGTYLNAAERALNPVSVAIIGPLAQDGTKALVRTAMAVRSVYATLHPLAPEQRFPKHHPAQGKQMIGGQATAYVCRGPTCSMPVTTANALEALLRSNAS